MTNTIQTNKQVPKAAMRLSLGPCKFGSSADDSKTTPVSMVAHTGQPIEHWFWGRVVHDLAGMNLAGKTTIPIDYCHEDDEVLGFLDTFDAASGNLVVSGQVVPFQEGDRANEVIYKAQAGVPWEASINFCGDGITVEEVGQGAVTQVNGYTFQGPGIVIRTWPLRGVAICPYGADANTSTELSADKGNSLSVVYMSAKSTKENPMDPADKAKLTSTEVAPPAAATEVVPPVTEKSAEPVATPAPAAQLTQSVEAKFTAADYITNFGDVGARWFLEGKTFGACTADFTKQLKDTHAAELKLANDKTAALQARLDALPRGEEGVKFNAADATPAAKEAKALESKVPGGLAKFAAAMTLPGQAK